MYVYILIYIKQYFRKENYISKNHDSQEISSLSYNIALELFFSFLDGIQGISLYFSVTKYDLTVYINPSTLPPSILLFLWKLGISFWGFFVN